MKITVIHGQSHKGSTYNIAKQLCDKLDGEVTEFFLPKDFEGYCNGCRSRYEKCDKGYGRQQETIGFETYLSKYEDVNGKSEIVFTIDKV